MAEDKKNIKTKWPTGGHLGLDCKTKRGAYAGVSKSTSPSSWASTFYGRASAFLLPLAHGLVNPADFVAVINWWASGNFGRASECF